MVENGLDESLMDKRVIEKNCETEEFQKPNYRNILKTCPIYPGMQKKALLS